MVKSTEAPLGCVRAWLGRSPTGAWAIAGRHDADDNQMKDEAAYDLWSDVCRIYSVWIKLPPIPEDDELQVILDATDPETSWTVPK